MAKISESEKEEIVALHLKGKSHREICEWVSTQHGKTIDPTTVHRAVKKHLTECGNFAVSKVAESTLKTLGDDLDADSRLLVKSRQLFEALLDLAISEPTARSMDMVTKAASVYNPLRATRDKSLQIAAKKDIITDIESLLDVAEGD